MDRSREVEAPPEAALPAKGRESHIVHLTAEYWPLVRTGGLGEAVRGIATFQSQTGSDATVVLPLYRSVREGGVELRPLGDESRIQIGPRSERFRLWEANAEKGGPRVVLIENEEYFGRAGVYGEGGRDYEDNHLRFSLFCAAAVSALPSLTPGPIVLHTHDWHTAMAIVYLRHLGRGDPFLDRIATVLSVHNGGFQGHFPPEILPEIGLPMELYSMEIMEWYGRANILKAGLVFTDMATTVSPSHASELRTEPGGFGLHHTFLGLRNRFIGVLNGIDLRLWDPGTDEMIPAPYSSKDLSGKAACKAALQEEFDLPQDSRKLVIGMVARMVSQKGLDLILGGRALREADAQFIFLGTGEPRFEDALQKVAAAHPDRVAVKVGFQDTLEHRIIAGSDALMMPSLYEPCGLTQMRALRYGTIPLARRVGGLQDTLEDGNTGFLFYDYEPDRLDWTINRAVTQFRNAEAWGYMMARAMRRDFSWRPAVRRYYQAYDRAFKVRNSELSRAGAPA